MKVLFITNIPSPYRLEFFNELGKYCDLTVWFEAETESNRSWRIELEAMNFTFKFLKGMTIGLDKHINFSVLKELRQEAFDIYVLGSYSSPTEMAIIQWLKYNKMPFFLNSDGGFPAQEGRLKRRIKKHFISSASRWLSSGRNCTEYLIYYGADRNCIFEYPFSSSTYSQVELQPIQPTSIEEFKRREQLKAKVVISVGQFIERKGYLEFLNDCHKLDDGNTSFILIGSGPLKNEYQRLIESKKLAHVIIKDFMNRDELIHYYKIADIFVLPTRYDVWGLVINEAMAFGLPIVTTTCAGAAHSLIEHGKNGFILEPSDIEKFMDHCKVLLDDQKLREDFAKSSLEKSKEYTINNMVNKHMAYFLDFMSEKAKNRRGDYEPDTVHSTLR